MKTWKASNLSETIYKTGIEFIEFQDIHGNWLHFSIIITPKRIVFGDACNTGFIESGYILREPHESINESLQELQEDLEVYYNDGPHFVSRIVCNERM